MADNSEPDVVVAGAGMSGLVAATEVADQDLDVVLLEKAPRAGGSMALSAGLVWTYDSIERARNRVPLGNPELQELIVNSIDSAFDWLKTHDIELEGPPFIFPGGIEIDDPVPGEKVAMFEPEQLINRLTETIERSGSIRFCTSLKDVLLDDSGKVCGVKARDEDDNEIQIPSKAAILATGGFQGNKGLLDNYVRGDSNNLWLRSNPWSTGDGLTAALNAGALTAGDMGTFNSAIFPAPPADVNPDTYIEAVQSYGSDGIIIDRNGLRISDESESPYHNPIGQDIAKKANGRGFIIVDEEIATQSPGEGPSIKSQIENVSKELGGTVIQSTSLNDLKEKLFDAGIDGERAKATIENYNERIESGETHLLDPPRRRNHNKIHTQPYYVVPVQPAITFTNGGIGVNKKMEVLSRFSSKSRLAPYQHEDLADGSKIKGMYAAGVDVGNISHREYFGGLSHALVTGLVAGREASSYSK